MPITSLSVYLVLVSFSLFGKLHSAESVMYTYANNCKSICAHFTVCMLLIPNQVFMMLTFLSLLKANFGCGQWRTFRLYLLSTCDLFSLKYSPDISNFLCPMINSYSVTAFFNATKKCLLNYYKFVIQ